MSRKKRDIKFSKAYNFSSEPSSRLSSEAKEKIWLVAFLVFAIVAVILLFRAPSTGHVVVGADLDKTALTTTDKLSGTINLELQDGDMIPADAIVKVYVSSNVSKCPANYICPDDTSKKVPWKKYNESTDECEIITADPESACCVKTGTKCSQRIADSSFTASGLAEKLVYWSMRVGTSRGVPTDAVSVGSEDVEETNETTGEEETYTNYFGATSTTEATKTVSNATLFQNLGTSKQVKINELKPGIVDNTAPTAMPYVATTAFTTSQVSMRCTTQDDIALKNATLYGDFGGSWHAEETKSITGNGPRGDWFYKTLADGTYKFTCGACDAAGNCFINATNKTFTVSVPVAPPTINYIAPTPAEGAAFTLDNTITVAIESDKDLSEANFSPVGEENITMIRVAAGNNKKWQGSYKIVWDRDTRDYGLTYRAYGKSGTTWYALASRSYVTCRSDQPCIVFVAPTPANNAVGTASSVTFNISSSSMINGNPELWLDNVKTTATWNCDSARRYCWTTASLSCSQTGTAHNYYVKANLSAATSGYKIVNTEPTRKLTCGGATTGGEVTSESSGNEFAPDLSFDSVTGNPILGEEAEWGALPSWEEEQAEEPEYHSLSVGPGVGASTFNSLTWKARISETAENGVCAFEFMVNSSAGRRLHYYYPSTDCTMPASTASEKYIKVNDLINVQSEDLFTEIAPVSRDLYSDWNASFGAANTTDTVTSIELISHGKKITILGESTIYGQTINWDDVELRKWASGGGSKSCNDTINKKKCCMAGAGIGDYYGDQLECEEGYECWSNCTQSWEVKFSSFVSGSSTATKYNKKTNADVASSCVGSEGCEDWSGCGDDCGKTCYGFCSDTSDTAEIKSCKGWDNVYSYSLSKLSPKIAAIKTNGSYALNVALTYNSPACGQEYTLFETSTPFTVGEGGEEVCTPHWINCTNTTKCDETTSYSEVNLRACEDENACGEPCPETICKIFGETGETCPTPTRACTLDDYTCDWKPALCSKDGEQTGTCELAAADCNATAVDAETPTLTRECTTAEISQYIDDNSDQFTRKAMESKLSSAGWDPKDSEIKNSLDDAYPSNPVSPMLWVIIIVILAIAVVLILMIRKKKGGKGPARGKSVPPELLSYIRDALAAGATKAEITSRLVEAGWPRDSVDAALRSMRL
jgi:hypothetical protein